MNHSSENNHLISVIIPVYHVEDYLAECLLSVITQSFKHIEIICIIDGSKDNSFNIARYYQMCDDRIKIIWQENQGLSGARNTGLEVAQGDFIFFLDSDDFLKQDALASLYQYIEQYDVVSGAVLNYVQDTGVTRPFCQHRQTGEIDIQDNFYSLETVVWNKLYRSEVVKNLRFIPRLVHEDEDFYWKVFSQPLKIYAAECHIIYYRIRSDSIMSSLNPDPDYQYNYIQIIDSAYSQLQEAPSLKYTFYKAALRFLKILISSGAPYHAYENHIKMKYKIKDSRLCKFRFKYL
ncbi:Putative glycosyltransferase EpsH [Vibrio aerogenes CECT 7868]|uniref:Putative glycosyltransferase EpsH n=1 Tax=Vibrio aerogenes CECT 7868 TaxID=1216006 RepID=A0A1M5ZBT0_9VIBR|nr:glycosyltransferase family 2 protein [Vibrio aerogenes]SHI21671.1 Putative glycosyltransferase EpsH [Vibrio aerogenes CECT 7868]